MKNLLIVIRDAVLDFICQLLIDFDDKKPDDEIILDEHEKFNL